jgi:hypothetical protein
VKRKSLLWIILASFALAFMAGNANAIFIQVGTGGPYSFSFTIENTGNPLVYLANLTNTSPGTTQPPPLIDLLAFNMNATLGEDFTVPSNSINPAWRFGEGSRGVQFDYVISRVSPMDRLEPNEDLTFDFVFTGEDVFPDPQRPFDIWLNVDPSLGTGIGGGDDLGQVAVSFQQLGPGGGGSDLVAADWQQENPIPEPGTVLLMGIGLLGIFGLRGGRKLFKKQ